MTVFTDRLRLEPVSAESAADLGLVVCDPEVWPWYSERCPTRADVEELATGMGESWTRHGVHKWLAYDRSSGDVIGRGGLSRTPVDDDWAQVYRFLPPDDWVSVSYDEPEPYVAHANWLELGWALRRRFWGRGYAAEIGRAGLAFAFERLAVSAVVSCTTRHNRRSRAVMERIGMRYAGEVRSRGLVEGERTERDDAPFATCVLLRDEWSV
ncbi:GNAT family N-acetyltransferase [Flexivirga sp. B27]